MQRLHELILNPFVARALVSPNINGFILLQNFGWVDSLTAVQQMFGNQHAPHPLISR